MKIPDNFQPTNQENFDILCSLASDKAIMNKRHDLKQILSELERLYKGRLSLNISFENKGDEAHFLFLLAYWYSDLRDYQKACDYFSRSKKMIIDHEDKTILTLLGLLLHNYIKVLIFLDHEQAVSKNFEILKKLPDAAIGYNMITQDLHSSDTTLIEPSEIRLLNGYVKRVSRQIKVYKSLAAFSKEKKKLFFTCERCDEASHDVSEKEIENYFGPKQKLCCSCSSIIDQQCNPQDYID